MATNPMSAVILHLRTAFGQDGAGMTDGELLTLFLDGRDQASLAALVQRHASMVWGVCCRLLRSHHDAEDAFQATFLVLVRKAASVNPREAVGNWLYGVAYQTAVRVRAMAAKRSGREKQVIDMPDPVVNEDSNDDFLSLLDQELNRLPSKHRLVIVLGDLEGKTRKELAQQLGISEGMVAGRLARAREMLAKRLTKRGVALSGGALAAGLSQSASASAPAPLVASTIQAANMVAEQAVSAGLISTQVVALTEGVVRAMFVSKIKGVLAVVLALGVVLGGLSVGHGLFETGEMEAQGGTNLFVPVDRDEVMQPQAKTGIITRDARKVSDLIGRHGVLFIHSKARLEELTERVPELKLDAKIDFAKQSVVVVHALIETDNTDNPFSLSKHDLAAKPPELSFSFTWDNRQMLRTFSSIKFIYVIIPATPNVSVTVTSTEAGSSAVATELSALLGGKDGGDIADGLRAVITHDAATIKPGDDILIDFALHLADPGKAKPVRFGKVSSAFVWDGKYSNGYRNHAFFVTTPDGKTTLLRPKVIEAWGKNAPHPVEITTKQPYHLSNWVEGDTRKSLKALGLDTTAPGTYRITGLYEEASQADGVDAGKKPMWGGSITSNTITVEVKK